MKTKDSTTPPTVTEVNITNRDCIKCKELDGQNTAMFFQFCSDHGIDTNMYFPIGLKMSESGIGKKIPCSVLLLEKRLYGVTLDEIAESLNTDKSIAKAIEVKIQTKYSDFPKYAKHGNLILNNSLSKYISRLEIKASIKE